MKKKTMYESLLLEILEVQIEKGYAFSDLPSVDDDGSAW